MLGASKSQLFADSLPELGSSTWISAVWIRPKLLHYVLRAGYAVMMAGNAWDLTKIKAVPLTLIQVDAWNSNLVPLVDADIAYTTKDVWDSLLAYTTEGGADGAFQEEFPGTHLVLGPLQ